MPKTHLFNLFLIFCVWLGINSCDYRDEQITTDSDKLLSFSLDTVMFDTVFSEMLTVSKTFRVYNPHVNALEFSASISGGSNSPFNLIVNGQEGGTDKTVSNLLIKGGDSLRVIVDAELDGRNESNPYLVLDSLQFLVNGNRQFVFLEAFGRDAYYHQAETVCDSVWPNDKPHVILNYLFVEENCTLTIPQGTEVYLNNFLSPTTGRGSNIFVDGTLLIEGTKEDLVSIQGVRREEQYVNAPGQWGAIFIRPGGQAEIRHALIREGLRGVQLGLPFTESTDEPERALALIRDSEIRGMEEFGVIGYDAGLNLFNCVISDCGEHNFSMQKGGRATVIHNTFAYSGNFFFSRKPPGVLLADFFPKTQTELITAPLSITFQNNIVDGPIDDELLLSLLDAEDDTLGFSDNVVKLLDQELRASLDTSHIFLPFNYDNIVVGETFTLDRMRFEDAQEYNFLPEDSVRFTFIDNGLQRERYLKAPGIDEGFNFFNDPIYSNLQPFINFDKQNTSRQSFLPPDIGALETSP